MRLWAASFPGNQYFRIIFYPCQQYFCSLNGNLREIDYCGNSPNKIEYLYIDRCEKTHNLILNPFLVPRWEPATTQQKARYLVITVWQEPLELFKQFDQSKLDQIIGPYGYTVWKTFKARLND